MTYLDTYIEKKYGKYLFKDFLLTIIFVIVFLGIAVLLKPFWDIGGDTILAKIGTMTSITGVFLGTYIALWLINQNRTKRIEENFFYKIGFLTNVQGMLDAVYQISFNIKVDVEQGNLDEKNIERIKISCLDDFNYWKNEIEKINANTSVPADIRTRVSLLIHQGIKPITSSSEDIKIQEHMVQTTLLNILDRLIDSKYFSSDCDKDVKHYLKQVIKWRDMLVNSVTPTDELRKRNKEKTK